MQPTLFTEPHAFDSIVIRWTALEKECPISYRTVQPFEVTLDAMPCFVDHDLNLVEHGAIVNYLFERYPGVSLLPSDPKVRAQLRQMCMLIRRGEVDNIVADVNEMVSHGNTWVAGEEFTLADIYVGARLSEIERAIPCSFVDHKYVYNYWSRLEERPAFKEAMS